jgi:hypothetical protein
MQPWRQGYLRKGHLSLLLKDEWCEGVSKEKCVNGSLVEDYEKTSKDVSMKRSMSRRCEELGIGGIENQRIR